MALPRRSKRAFPRTMPRRLRRSSLMPAQQSRLSDSVWQAFGPAGVIPSASEGSLVASFLNPEGRFLYRIDTSSSLQKQEFFGCKTGAAPNSRTIPPERSPDLPVLYFVNRSVKTD